MFCSQVPKFDATLPAKYQRNLGWASACQFELLGALGLGDIKSNPCLLEAPVGNFYPGDVAGNRANVRTCIANRS